MGQNVSQTEFEWAYTEEPHRTRRKEILAKYPDVQKLMGHDPQLKYTVLLMCLVQLVTVYFVQDCSWFTLVLLAYFFGGVINHSLSLAIHEISHNHAFGHSKPMHNRIFGMIANLPMGIPYSTVFKKYHIEHHKYQGDDEKDVDIPTRMEGLLFHRTSTKFLWLLLQPFFYAIRPLFIRPKPITKLEVANFIVQAIFDGFILYAFGFRSLMYLAFGTFLAMGVHPMAGHFISEHYVFTKGYETYSYYGILNKITFNVGYHNEHHDFPNIPGCNLPKLKAMVPEYYDNLPCYESWSKVLYDFVMDPKIGPFSRIKRKNTYSTKTKEAE